MAQKTNLNDKNYLPNEEELKKIHEELGIDDEDEEDIEEVENEDTTEDDEEEVVDTEEEEDTEDDDEDEDDDEEEVEEAPKPKKTTKNKTTTKKKPEKTTATIKEKKKKTSTSKPRKELDPNDILSNLTVDLNDIIINDEKLEMDKVSDFEFVLNNKPTYQIVLNQSCYIAHMQGLKLAEINMLNSSNGGAFEQQQRNYQVLHKMINTTSIGRLDFKTFLKVTSYFDLPTLYFGTYMETFPGKTEFTITCGHCKQSIDVKIDNESFISVKDENVYSHMQSILSSVRKPEEALKNSLVNKIEKKMLPSSKVILEIQTPSLLDHLNLLSSIKEDKIDEMRSMLLTLLFVKKAYFPDINAIRNTGKPVYFTVTSRQQIFNIIRNLAPEDISALGDSIEKYIDKYAIEYKIKSFKCTNCQEEVGDISVDMESLLFQRLRQL